MDVRKVDLEILQGETFVYVVRWSKLPIIYKPITAMPMKAPVRLTVTGHGVPDGWPVAILGVAAPKDLNALTNPPKEKDYRKATLIDADTIELNELNGVNFDNYTSGGVLQYFTPVSLAAFTARMSFKDKVGGTLLGSFTTGNGSITLDDTAKTITITISATTTAAFGWVKGVYDLEMVSGSGVVTRIMEGSVKVSKEVTTT